MFSWLKVWERKSLSCIGVLVSSIAGAQSPWTYLGPDGGRVTYLIQDVAAPTTLYAGSQGGFFRSTDAGTNWTLMGPVGSLLPTGNWPLLQDAEMPSRFYTTHAGVVWRSNDGAATWTASDALPSGDSIIALIDVPGASDRLYALSARWGVLYSEDGAQHWVMHNNGLPPGFLPAALAISHNNPSIQLLRRNDENSYFGAPLYRSTDGGASWQATGLSGSGYQSHLALFGAGTRAYAVVGLDLYSSNDLGATWGSPKNLQRYPRALLADSSNPDVLLAARDDGVFRTVDAGATWTPLNVGLDANSISKASVSALVQDVGDPTGMHLWAATDRSGVFRSEDAGLHWTAHVSGLAANSFRAVSVHPRHPARVLAATGEEIAVGSGTTLYVSDDGGASWSPSDLGPMAGLLRDIVVDPTTTADVASTYVYAVGRSAGGQPRNGGIYRSVDGGTHWTSFDQALPHFWFGNYSAAYLGKLRSIALDPRSCVTPPASGICTQGPLRTLYFTADGFGGNFTPAPEIFRVARTDDEGASWTDLGGDLPQAWDDGQRGEILTPLSLVIDPQNSNVLYLGTFDNVWGDGVAPPPPQLANGFFRSDDRGQHWLWRSSGLPLRTATTAYDVGSLAAHPRRSGVLWVAVNDLEAGTPSRIYKTEDGGEHWTATCTSSITSATCGLNNCDVRTLAVDAAAPDVLYAGGYATDGGRGCVYRSEDGGQWWVPIGGDVWASAATAFARDGSDSTRFVIGTNTGTWQLRSPSDKIFIDDFGY